MIRKIYKFGLLFIFLLAFILNFGINSVSAETASLSFSPAQVIQGEPILVKINGLTKISAVKKLTFDGEKIGVFIYQGEPSALIGIRLIRKPGAYDLVAELSDGSVLKEVVNVGERQKIEVPLGIPPKLGGDTKQSQDKLVTTLVAERNSLANIPTSPKALWSDKFNPPLKEIFVTDPYGFSRKTGEYSIPHIGVDYKAKVGTPVMAVNRGVVRLTKNLRNYGNMIILDHGLGLMTYYLHLSKIKVKVGQVVKRGQVVGLSGQTGYALGPHLHLSVVIKGVAVDAEKFFKLFQF